MARERCECGEPARFHADGIPFCDHCYPVGLDEDWLYLQQRLDEEARQEFDDPFWGEYVYLAARL